MRHPLMSRWCLRLAALVALAAGFAAWAGDPTCPPSAQAPTPEQVQAGMKAARDRGFLWRVQKNGHSSYLYGTVHIARADWMYPGVTLKGVEDNPGIAGPG